MKNCENCGKEIEFGALCDDCLDETATVDSTSGEEASSSSDSVDMQVEKLNKMMAENETEQNNQKANEPDVYNDPARQFENRGQGGRPMPPPRRPVPAREAEEQRMTTGPLIIFSILSVILPPVSLIAGIVYANKPSQQQKVFGKTMIAVSVTALLILGVACCFLFGFGMVIMEEAMYY